MKFDEEMKECLGKFISFYHLGITDLEGAWKLWQLLGMDKNGRICISSKNLPEFKNLLGKLRNQI